MKDFFTIYLSKNKYFLAIFFVSALMLNYSKEITSFLDLENVHTVFTSLGALWLFISIFFCAASFAKMFREKFFLLSPETTAQLYAKKEFTLKRKNTAAIFYITVTVLLTLCGLYMMIKAPSGSGYGFAGLGLALVFAFFTIVLITDMIQGSWYLNVSPAALLISTNFHALTLNWNDLKEVSLRVRHTYKGAVIKHIHFQLSKDKPLVSTDLPSVIIEEREFSVTENYSLEHEVLIDLLNTKKLEFTISKD